MSAVNTRAVWKVRGLAAVCHCYAVKPPSA